MSKNKSAEEQHADLYVELEMWKDSNLSEGAARAAAAISWLNLTEAEKKGMCQKVKGGRLPGHDLMRKNAAEFMEERRFNVENDKIVSILGKAKSMEDLCEMNFFFVHAEYFRKTTTDIWPGEIAVSKFSLDKGTYGSLCLKIRPHEFDSGTTLEMKAHSEKCHKMDPDNIDESAVNYLDVFNKITNFLDEPVEPCLLVTNNNKGGMYDTGLADIQKILDKISAASDRKIQFQLIDVNRMMTEVQRLMELNANVDFTLDGRRIVDDEESKTLITTCLNSSTLLSDLACDYHYFGDDSRFCCLNKVTCVADVFMKYCSYLD